MPDLSGESGSSRDAATAHVGMPGKGGVEDLRTQVANLDEARSSDGVSHTDGSGL